MSVPDVSLSIHDQISKTEKEMKENNAAISRSLRELAALQRRQNQLGAELRRLRATVAPIMLLPYEILARIFEIGFHEVDEEPEWFESLDRKEDPEEEHFPTIVSHVNRHFRHVAVTTASLWTHIDMTEEWPYDRTKLWIERAKGCPLRIDLDFTRGTFAYEKPRPHDMVKALEVLLPASRWASFSVRVDTLAAMHTVLQQCSTEAAPELRFLELINDSNLYDEDDLESPDLKQGVNLFMGDAPLLEEVALYGVHLPWQQPMLAGLRCLELEYHPNEVKPTVDQWISLMRASPGLKHLMIRASGPFVPNDSSTDPVALAELGATKLEHLEKLELADLHPPELAFVLRMLNLPSLQSIALENMEFEDGDYTETFLLVSSARYPLLKKLKFVHCYEISDESVEALFRGVPTVEELDLREHADKVLPLILLAEMMDSEDGANNCPEARVILPKMWCLKTKGCDFLEEFVRQRQQMGHPLTHVLVDTDDIHRMAPDNYNFFRNNVTLGFFEDSDGDEEDEDEMDDETMEWNSSGTAALAEDVSTEEHEADDFGGDVDEWFDED